MSQNNEILQYLKAGNIITPLEALTKFGSMRLGARIWDLRKQGWDIEAQDISSNGKHFASYRLRVVEDLF